MTTVPVLTIHSFHIAHIVIVKSEKTLINTTNDMILPSKPKVEHCEETESGQNIDVTGLPLVKN